MTDLRGLRITEIIFEGANLKQLAELEKMPDCKLSDVITQQREGFASLKASGKISVMRARDITEKAVEKILTSITDD